MAAVAASAAVKPSRATSKLLKSILRLQPKPPKLILDSLSPTPSHLLNVSLAHQLPTPFFPAYFQAQHRVVAPTFRPPSPAQALPMPTGHHLVYFPPQLQALTPDGTDPDHCPGDPFERRMWAGGSIEFADRWEDSFRLDGRQVSCIETIGTPDLKLGPTEADEKLFVDVTRRYFTGDVEPKLEELAEGLPDPLITEVRRLVFFRSDETKGVVRGPRKPLRAQPTATFETSIQPDRALLFHFSALTFNAHAIHLDREYTRQVEHHRDLLVHGPLTLLLMLSALQVQAGDLGRVARLDYRNLAPLYVDDTLTVCLKEAEDTCPKGVEDVETTSGDSKTYSVWVTGPQGGLAVKGTATLQPRP